MKETIIKDAIQIIHTTDWVKMIRVIGQVVGTTSVKVDSGHVHF